VELLQQLPVYSSIAKKTKSVKQWMVSTELQTADSVLGS
jgi:hypothetical protein